MKILHIVPYYKPAYIYGGPIESVSKMCEGLAAQGHLVDVYTTLANGDDELDFPSGIPVLVDGVNVSYFKRSGKGNAFSSPVLWRQLSRTVKSYDVVHIQTWWNLLAIVSAWICYRNKVKMVTSPRGMLSTYIINSGQVLAKKIIHNTIGRFILSKTTFHATARSEYRECKEIIPGWNGFVLPNIISLPEIKILKNENAVFTLIFMSRIHPKKGIELLLRAISELSFKVRLRIAGDGEAAYITQLKELVVSLKIADQVEWLGWVEREDKFLALTNADLFVLASYNENFANVVIESLHVGTPVLVSYGVALSEFVMQNDMGWVTNLEINEICEQITAAYQDSDKRNRIQQEGRAIIDDNFSPGKLVDKYVREYKKVINQS
ncbi:MAG: glycosyltransferase [Bacteroidota bacterium]